MSPDQLREALELLDRLDKLAEYLDYSQHEHVKKRIDQLQGFFHAKLAEKESGLIVTWGAMTK